VIVNPKVETGYIQNFVGTCILMVVLSILIRLELKIDCPESQYMPNALSCKSDWVALTDTRFAGRYIRAIKVSIFIRFVSLCILSVSLFVT